MFILFVRMLGEELLPAAQAKRVRLLERSRPRSMARLPAPTSAVPTEIYVSSPVCTMHYSYSHVAGRPLQAAARSGYRQDAHTVEWSHLYG